MRSPVCLCILVGLVLIEPAAAQNCDPAETAAMKYAPIAALNYDVWLKESAWADLPERRRDLLARVSTAQRAVRACNPGKYTLYTVTAADLGTLRTGEPFIEAGVADLDRLVEDANDALAHRAPESSLIVSNTFRVFDAQRHDWARNLRKYFGELKAKLATRVDASGKYDAAAVELLRQYVSLRYAFPGYSLHQSGRAVDFHIRVKGGPELGASTGASNRAAWCESKAFGWLRTQARRYRFVQTAAIDEPWHWSYKPNATDADFNAVAPSCRAH